MDLWVKKKPLKLHFPGHSNVDTKAAHKFTSFCGVVVDGLVLNTNSLDRNVFPEVTGRSLAVWFGEARV